MKKIIKLIDLDFEDRALEKRYREENAKQNTKYFRYSIALGTFTALYFALVDQWTLPIHADYGLHVRLYFMVPVLILLVASTFHRNFYKFVDYATITAAITSVASITLIVYQAERSEPAYDMYYAGIMLVNVWISSYLKARFKPALFAVTLNNLIYICLAVFHQDYLTSTDPQRINILFANLSFIIPVNFISLLGCRETEVYQRREFLLNELRIEQSAKLIDASRLAALGEMAAGIAHEINNPLSIIVSSVHSIERKVKDKNLDNNQLESGLLKITNASNRIVNIIKSLKIYSRDGSKDEMKFELLTSVISDSLFYCQEKFTHSGIKMTLDTIPTVSIKCRITQVSQVIVNLLNNSIDAFDETIPDPHIKIEFKTGAKFVEVSIIDNGKGIPTGIRDKIMQPFFTTKSAGKGTGLGLSLSKEIIEQHGGNLTLHECAIGTKISFTLPIT